MYRKLGPFSGMSDSQKFSNQEIEPISKLDALLNSPVRLITLCVALLVFSLMTGMMIGTFIKDKNSPDQIASSEVEEIFKPGFHKNKKANSAPADPTNETGAATGNRPIDALAYDPTDYRNAPKGVLSDSLPKNDQVASLPPAEILKAFPKVGEPRWQKYAIPVTITSGAPLIAIVIDDVGLNGQRVDKLLDLPTPLTLAFLPYANNLQKYSEMTRSRGHEVMLHLPMEPTSRTSNPGPDALLQDLSPAEILQRTKKNLDSFDGYVGVNNHMGSKFTAFEPGMAIVMDEIAARGLLFLDSRTTAKSKGYDLALARHLPTGNRDIFLDNEIKPDAIMAQLKKVEAFALKNGTSIAIGHPYNETIEALRKWIPEARKRGFQFIPITAALAPNIARAN